MGTMWCTPGWGLGGVQLGTREGVGLDRVRAEIGKKKATRVWVAYKWGPLVSERGREDRASWAAV